jgi:long-chain fatty acid transport protein
LLSLFGTCSVALLIPAQAADASGFYLQEQSVRGWGRANSGEVADQGAASLWWNPASVGWRGEGEEGALSVSFGATGILPSGRIEDAGTQIDRPVVAAAPVGGVPVLRDPVQKGVLPATAVAFRLSDRIALGLAISSPYSFTTDYDPAGWQRYSAIRTSLLTLDVQPSVAVAVAPWLSAGAGVNIEFADASLSNALPNLAPGSPDGRLLLEGKGWDFGWSAGAQLRPAPGVTFGIAYKSAIEHKIAGHFEVTGLLGPLAIRNRTDQMEGDFSTPWQLIFGGRAALAERVTLNAQIVRFGWSKFDQINLGPPLNTFIPQGYRNTWSYAFGVDGELSDSLTLRSGIQFDQTPTQNRDARVPDSNRVNYNVGATMRAGRKLQFDAAASYTDFKTVAITRDERFYAGTAAQVDVFTEGRARAQRAIVVSLGGRMAF